MKKKHWWTTIYNRLTDHRLFYNTFLINYFFSYIERPKRSDVSPNFSSKLKDLLTSFLTHYQIVLNNAYGGTYQKDSSVNGPLCPSKVQRKQKSNVYFNILERDDDIISHRIFLVIFYFIFQLHIGLLRQSINVSYLLKMYKF